MIRRLYRKTAAFLLYFYSFSSLFLPIISVAPVYASESETSETVEVTDEQPAEETGQPEPTPVAETEEPATEPTEEPATETETEPSPTPTPAEELIPDEATEPSSTSDPDTEQSETEASLTLELTPALEPVEEELFADLQTNESESSATLSTDKGDYAPTDIATITGSGLLADTSYSIVIYSDDEPVVRHEGNLTTDGQGSFVYLYQLDGTYRPHYTVEVYDSGGVLVATTSFTDAPISGCNQDSAGADDEPGQKDLTEMCVEYGGLPSTIDVQWNWDDISWSGNNSGDACSLFDTNGNGYADFALCVTVKGDPASLDSYNLYSCNDTSAERCFGSTAVAFGSTTCSADVQAGSNPFDAGSDTVASCTIDMTAVAGAQLLDVCSYPSQSPNSDPSDCIVFQDNSGKLELVKILDPENDNGLFDLQIDGINIVEDVGHEGTTGEQVLDADTYSISEIAGTDTNLDNYSSSIVCQDLNGIGEIVSSSDDSGPLDIVLTEGDDIVCTFTNTLQSSSLTVIKNVTNDDGGTLGASDFNLYIDGNPAISGESNTLNAGTYTVSEDEVTGYTAGTWSGDCATDGTVTVNPGDDLTCTITNDDQAGTLIVRKVVDNQYGGELEADDFTFQVDDSAPTSFEADGENEIEVDAGTYTVTEPAVAGYQTSYDNCTDVVVSNGETEVCTITNSDLPGTLIVEKVLIQDNGGTESVTDFSFQINGETAIPFEDDGENEATVSAGTYNITEPAVAGYDTSYENCTDVVVTNGSTETCTITNNDQPGTLIVEKVVNNQYGGILGFTDFSFQVNGNSEVAFEADGTNEIDVSAGTYNVTEPAVAGYQTSYDNCEDVEVSNGETEVCTITNSDLPGKLIVEKILIQNNGGAESVTDFSFQINGETAIPFESDGENEATVSAGTYTVIEPAIAGYDTTYDNCAELVITNGDTETCTITNDDQPAQLTVIKEVVNDNGGNAVASDFTMQVAGTNVSDDSFPGDESGTQVTLNAGSYSVDESDFDGYEKTLGENCSGTIGLGESVTCTITNNDIAPTITLVKDIVDQYGDDATADDFGLVLGGNGVSSGVAETVEANTPYTVGEVGLGGYQFLSVTGDDQCPEVLGGSVTLAEGEDVTCTITNQGVQPQLTVTKLVASGSAQVTDFDLYVDQDQVTSGQATGFDIGDYVVSEDPSVLGYTGVISGDCDVDGDVSLALGDNKACTITNTRDTGGLIVHKIIDADGDLQTTDDQFVGEGWEMDVDGQSEDTSDPSSQLTDANGETTFSPIHTGTYDVSEVMRDGYELLDAYCDNESGSLDDETLYSVDVAKDETVECTFINHPDGTIHGFKWHDRDANGELDFSEEFLGGWRIFIDENDNQQWDDGEPFQLTDDGAELGLYWFENLFPGEYQVCEVLETGWWQTFPSDPSCHTITLPDDNLLDLPELQNEVFGPVYNFGNQQLANVTVIKYLDEDGDGEFDQEETTLEDWQIQLGELAETTDENGEAVFADVVPGGYVLSETIQEGYEQTAISCYQGELEGDDNQLELQIGAGEEVTCEIGNHPLTPVLSLTKANDTGGADQDPGDTVEFTLTVTATESAAVDVEVVDLPAGGFDYQEGSFTATSDLNGPLSIPEPVYASPGTWFLGDMAENETITLTYLAQIGGTQEPGLYQDLAWAQGDSLIGEQVLANADSDPTYFAGTQVNVVTENQETASVDIVEEREGEVLGASTELPATGAQEIWLVIGSLLTVGGALGIKKGLQLQKKYEQI